MNGGFFSRIFFEYEKVASPQLDPRLRGNDANGRTDFVIEFLRH